MATPVPVLLDGDDPLAALGAKIVRVDSFLYT